MALAKVVSAVLLILFFLEIKASPADTLIVIFDRQNFVQGDSIDIEIYAEPYQSNPPAKTLHLWIENIKTGQRWKFRYPFLKGRYKLSLKINDSIPKGTYAFNFLLQNKFLAVKGKLKNAGDDDNAVNYIAMSKNKAPIIDDAELNSDGSFKIDNLFYTDSVYFGFSPVMKTKVNPLKIAIETPLDSIFVPEVSITEFITIGNGGIQIEPIDSVKNNYIFSKDTQKDKQLLKMVVMQTKITTKRKKFENENVSGLFASDNAKTIDFYENDELMNYPDIYSYLTANVAGLTTYYNEENGKTILYWRKDTVNIFVDEVLDRDFSPISLSVQEIEMLKIYSPGSRLGLDGFGGSVAIYTRRMSNRPGNKLSNYSFYVKGYTQKYAEWK